MPGTLNLVPLKYHIPTFVTDQEKHTGHSLPNNLRTFCRRVRTVAAAVTDVTATVVVASMGSECGGGHSDGMRGSNSRKL